jgi:hypothetical protein
VSQDTWRRQSPPVLGVGFGVMGLDLSLCVGVPDLQGVDSGHQAHLKRGSERTGGANIFFPVQL